MKKIKLLASLFSISCFVLPVSFSSCAKAKEDTKRKVILTGTDNADLSWSEDDNGMTIIYNMHQEGLTVLYANVSINGTKLNDKEYKLDIDSPKKSIFIAKSILNKYPGDIVVDSKVEKKAVTSLQVKYNDNLHFQSKSILLHSDIYIKKIYNDKTYDKTFSPFSQDFTLLINHQPILDFYDNGYIFNDQQELETKVDFIIQYSKDNVEAPLTIPLAKLTDPLIGIDLETPSQTECYIKLSDDAKRITGTITIPETLSVSGKAKKVIGVAPSGFYGSYASNIIFANENNITILNNLAFAQSRIIEFCIPKTVTSLSDSTFNTCFKMKKITFDSDSQISLIPERCFFNCRSLTTISLPKTVIKIAKRAFDGCYLLDTINIQYEGTNEWIISGSPLQKIDITNSSINAINLKNGKYDSENNWGYTGIEESTLLSK